MGSALLQGHPQRRGELEATRMWPGAVVANVGEGHPDQPQPHQHQWPPWPMSAGCLKTEDFGPTAPRKERTGPPGQYKYLHLTFISGYASKDSRRPHKPRSQQG